MKKIDFTPLQIKNSKLGKAKFVTGFTKMVASGHDFILVHPFTRSPVRQLKEFSRKICNRKFGIGADGLIILEKSKIADIKMRIFNPDGSEAEMCGNGARAVALWVNAKRKTPALPAGRQNAKLNIQTNAGIIESWVDDDNVKIKFTEPEDIRLNIPLKINNRSLKLNFINVGVPHTVIFVEALDKLDVLSLGRFIRYHKRFSPQGTNVNFVEILNNNSIKLRTYERGVEDETLACGTGAVASVLLYAIRYPLSATHKVNVYTKSGEILKVYFKKMNNSFKDVWLEGKAKIVYQGVYYV